MVLGVVIHFIDAMNEKVSYDESLYDVSGSVMLFRGSRQCKLRHLFRSFLTFIESLLQGRMVEGIEFAFILSVKKIAQPVKGGPRRIMTNKTVRNLVII